MAVSLPPVVEPADLHQQDRRLILVVDDTVELGLLVRTLGRRVGNEVVTCADAEGGSQFLQLRRPDLILLDHNLPGIRGIDWCRSLRATPEGASLPIALLGHWQLPQDILAGLEAGVDFVVSKDLLTDPGSWQTRLREILNWVAGTSKERVVSLRSKVSLAEVSATWAMVLNQALLHGSLRRLRPQIARFVLLRCLRRVLSPEISEAELECWIASDEAVLLLDKLPPVLCSAQTRESQERVILLVVSLAEETWRLLGREATAEFRSALALVVPGLEELLSF